MIPVLNPRILSIIQLSTG